MAQSFPSKCPVADWLFPKQRPDGKSQMRYPAGEDAQYWWQIRKQNDDANIQLS